MTCPLCNAEISGFSSEYLHPSGSPDNFDLYMELKGHMRDEHGANGCPCGREFGYTASHWLELAHRDDVMQHILTHWALYHLAR